MKLAQQLLPSPFPLAPARPPALTAITACMSLTSGGGVGVGEELLQGLHNPNGLLAFWHACLPRHDPALHVGGHWLCCCRSRLQPLLLLLLLTLIHRCSTSWEAEMPRGPQAPSDGAQAAGSAYATSDGRSSRRQQEHLKAMAACDGAAVAIFLPVDV